MTLDLSTAFGEPASARLRGLLPRRREVGDDDPPATAPTSDGRAAAGAARSAAATEAATEAATDTAPTDDPGTPPVTDGARFAGRRSPRPARSAAPAARRTGEVPPSAVPPSTTGNRRWGMARVASREHVDLLVLTALVSGPDHAAGIIEHLRAGSGGALRAPERTVHTTLHRLARNRLLRRVGPGPRGGPRYALTDAGHRAAAARVRQWRTFARAVDGVIAQNDAD